MANRRMFSLKIVDTDKFLEMPPTARLLYYDLSMRADDDGFVDSPKKIIQLVSATTDDFKILCAKEYIIPFNSGVVVIKDWRVHNLIRHDRYAETEYQKEKNSLKIDKNKYVIPCGNQLATQDRIGKDRIGKDRIGNVRGRTFTPPTDDEAFLYAKENGIIIDVCYFLKFFRDGNWIDSKGNQVKNWKQKMLTWNKREVDRVPSVKTPDTPESRAARSEEIRKIAAGEI